MSLAGGAILMDEILDVEQELESTYANTDTLQI